MILSKCEELLKKSGVAVRHDLHKLYSGLTNVWSMSAISKQIGQVRAAPSLSSSLPNCVLFTSLQLSQKVDEVLNQQVPPLRASLLSSLASGTRAKDMPLGSPAMPPTTPPVVVTPPGWPRPPPGPGGHPGSPYQPSPTSPYQPSPTSPYQPSPASHAIQPQVTRK